MEPIINWEMELESEGLKLNKFQRVYLSLKKEEKSIPHFQAKNINFWYVVAKVNWRIKYTLAPNLEANVYVEASLRNWLVCKLTS